MTALLIVVAALSANPVMRVHADVGEIEYIVPLQHFGSYHKGIVIHCIAHESDKTNAVFGYERGPFAGGYGQEKFEIPQNLPPSKRIAEPVITRSAIEVRVRFPSQWFNEDDVDIFIDGDKAVMTRTVVKKIVTEPEVKELSSTE